MRLQVKRTCKAPSTNIANFLFASCFFIGIVRIMLMLNNTFTIAPYLTGMNTLAIFTMTEEPEPAAA